MDTSFRCNAQRQCTHFAQTKIWFGLDKIFHHKINLNPPHILPGRLKCGVKSALISPVPVIHNLLPVLHAELLPTVQAVRNSCQVGQEAAGVDTAHHIDTAGVDTTEHIDSARDITFHSFAFKD